METTSAPAGWHPDPTGRFEFRYYNGQRWTADVSLNGQRFIDEVAPVTPGHITPGHVTPGHVTAGHVTAGQRLGPVGPRLQPHIRPRGSRSHPSGSVSARSHSAGFRSSSCSAPAAPSPPSSSASSGCGACVPVAASVMATRWPASCCRWRRSALPRSGSSSPGRCSASSISSSTSASTPSG
ncbi:MAG: DUF2510 domain-containing protein [Acidimicrobiaceae bacterium]|nr:DUF2510 domain-containing protein [Acidimicrobiaceae bacterium]